MVTDWTAHEDKGVVTFGTPTAAGDPHIDEIYADVTILMDRSGSMASMRQAVIEGLNGYFTKMKDQPGATRWTMVQFDDSSSAQGAKETFPKVVFENRAETDMVPLTESDFQPRGGTALVDATCMTIKDIDARISGKEKVQPVLMIVTDGEENSSRLHTTETLRKMIAERQEKGWVVSYLGANQDAWSVAGGIGIAQNFNNVKYNYTGSCIQSGAIASGAVGTFSANNYVPTSAGMTAALNSGMVLCAHMASGAAWTASQTNI